MHHDRLPGQGVQGQRVERLDPDDLGAGSALRDAVLCHRQHVDPVPHVVDA